MIKISISIINLTYHVSHSRISFTKVDHQTLQPVLTPVLPEARLVKLHYISTAICHCYVKIALVIVVSQECTCKILHNTQSLFWLS